MDPNQGHVHLLSQHAVQQMNADKNEILDLDSYQVVPIYLDGETQQYEERIQQPLSVMHQSSVPLPRNQYDSQQQMLQEQRPVSVIESSLSLSRNQNDFQRQVLQEQRPLSVIQSSFSLPRNQNDYQQEMLQKQIFLGVPDQRFHCSIPENITENEMYANRMAYYPGQWFQNEQWLMHDEQNPFQYHGIHIQEPMRNDGNYGRSVISGMDLDQQPNAFRLFIHGSSPPSDLVISSTQVSSSSDLPLDEFKKEADWECNEPEKPTTFNCTACNKWFTSLGHLNRHYSTNLHKNTIKSSEQPSPASPQISIQVHPVQTMDSTQVAAESSQCPDKFLIVNAADLRTIEETKVHVKRENTGYQLSFSTGINGDMPPTCHYCQKTFVKACYLTQHNMAVHNGLKPFKCVKCGKRFGCNVTYQEHLEKHFGDKPHKCQFCPKQFNHKTDLRRHIILHTGKKPHICETCGKGFIRKDHMKKHSVMHSRKFQSKVVADGC